MPTSKRPGANLGPFPSRKDASPSPEVEFAYYVSGSPFRVPLARLAAAQAALEEEAAEAARKAKKK
jgi:hypothetical protein